jgi:hypothetical protein
MKNTEKSSQNKQGKQNDDTLIYILLFFLIVLLVGGVVWHFYDRTKSSQGQETIDYESEIGKFETSPSVKELSKLLSDNNSRERTIHRLLDSRNRKNPAPPTLKKEIEEELNNNSISQLNNTILKNFDLKTLTPEERANVYKQLYEYSKFLVRLRRKATESRDDEELKEQYEIQKNWKISESEKKDIRDNMNKWISGWYHQFMEKELIRGEAKMTEYIWPTWIDGKKIDKPTPSQIARFREVHDYTNLDGSSGRVDLARPLWLEFSGFAGFLRPKDLEESSEGRETWGLTLSTNATRIVRNGERGDPQYTEWRFIVNNYRQIEIRLRKEFFFNRLSYNQWLVKVKGGNSSYYSINFDQVVETIAHELAHAIISSMKGEYDGEEGGGHGKYFYEVLDRMEKMIRKTPEFSEFETWWKKKKNNG